MLGDTDDLLKRVTELEQRAKIYELMQGLLGMQHGESFTILNPEIRAKYLKDGLNAPGGETLLAATPQRRLMTTYFDEGLSTLEFSATASSSTAISGCSSRACSARRSAHHRALNLLTLAELTRFHDAFRSITQYFGLSVFARLVGAARSAIDAEFDRSGEALQPGPDGGAEGYTPPPGGGRFAASAITYPTGPRGGHGSPSTSRSCWRGARSVCVRGRTSTATWRAVPPKRRRSRSPNSGFRPRARTSRSATRSCSIRVEPTRSWPC